LEPLQNPSAIPAANFTNEGEVTAQALKEHREML
jgi:hypothetical protein